MKRRTAIKNIGLGMGISVSTGTFLSMLASCKSESSTATVVENEWAPSFLTDKAQCAFVENLADIIFPPTDSPGAKEAGVIKYIDLMVDKIYKPEEQTRFRKGLETCIETVESEQGDKFSNLGTDKLTAFLESHIGSKADKAAHDARKEMLGEKEAPEDMVAQKEYYLYNFLSAVKSLTVGGFFASELIATEHMVYEPVPGPYEGCIDWAGGNNYYQ